MKKKLEITKRLEKIVKPNKNIWLSSKLDAPVAILNLPAVYACGKGCAGCIMDDGSIMLDEIETKLPIHVILEQISYFARAHDTRFITINGRGDPFHSLVKNETIEKIECAYANAMQAYVFTAGDSLNPELSKFLADHTANVMISLMGNDFIDSGFFEKKQYDGRDAETAGNLRTLIRTYRESDQQPQPDATRVGMNYVVSEEDLISPNKLRELRKAANENGIFFVSNLNFWPESDQDIREKLREFAIENSDFGLSHSTAVNGVCQMGAGSSITIAANGDIYRCPYMLKGKHGNISNMTSGDVRDLILRYQKDPRYACVVRKTKIER